MKRAKEKDTAADYTQVIMPEEAFNRVGCDLEQAVAIIQMCAQRVDCQEVCAALYGALQIIEHARGILCEEGKLVPRQREQEAA